MKDAKTIIKRYQSCKNISEIVIVIAILVVLTLPIPTAVKILSAIGLFLTEIALLAVLMSRISNPLLSRDFDPELYYTVSHGIGAATKTNDTVDITAAYYMYDYHTAYNLCLQKLEKTKSTGYRYWCKMIVSRIYFDTGEFDKLREMCEEFQTAFANNRYLAKQYETLFTYYSMFCDGDFQGCCDLYKTRMDDELYKRNTLFKVQIDYAYAVASYRNGDCDEASAYFHDILQTAPKLNFARLAKSYLDAMGSKAEFAVAAVCVKDENFTPPTVSSAKPPLAKMIVACVVIAVGLFVIVISLYNARPQEPLAALQAYDDTVQAVLTLQPINEQNDALCVYQNANTLPGIAYLDAKGEGLYQCKITLDGTETGWTYIVSASDSDLNVSCVIFDNEQDIPPTAIAHSAFCFYENTYYLVVTKTEEYNGLGYMAYVEDPEQVQSAFDELFK